jgi:hypothetical protein
MPVIARRTAGMATRHHSNGRRAQSKKGSLETVMKSQGASTTPEINPDQPAGLTRRFL